MSPDERLAHRDPVLDQPVYWFCSLDLAVARGDHGAAAEAQRQLARLGVRVTYGRPRAAGRRPRKGVPHAR
jgi:hypothetical protein